MFVADRKDEVDEYISELKKAGIKHMTFDTYSYSAASKGIVDNFVELGYDFERFYTLGCDI